MAYQNEYQNLEGTPAGAPEGRRTSAADYLISAKTLSKQIVDRGRKQADDIIAEAEARAEEIVNQARQKAEEILAEARRDAEMLREERVIPAGSSDQEHAVRCVEDCFARLRQHQQEAIDLLNEQWQQFLCSLYTEEEPAEESVPPDLSARVSAIAEAVEALEDSDE